MPVGVFGQICEFLSKRFDVIPLSEVDGYFKKSKRSAVVISFDDGHYDVLENAYPILKKHGLRFNINIVTESLEGGLPQDSVRVYDVLNSTEKNEYVNREIFPEPIKIGIDKTATSKTESEFRKLFQGLNREQRRLLSNDVVDKLANKSTRFSRVLSKEDVIYLSKNGAEVGSHTHSHPILTNCDIPEMEFELRHSKKVLEDLCNSDIGIIAFPQGLYNEAVIQKSFEAGYEYLLLTDERKNIVEGVNNSILDRIALYYETPDENLAKIFGFHQILSFLRTE
jgi:peptidoglycan/xylan/chitin deacetylase (PgdA/CDA1 family)